MEAKKPCEIVGAALLVKSVIEFLKRKVLFLDVVR